jgi:5-methylcytosine-specific restriction endonuclease McrA
MDIISEQQAKARARAKRWAQENKERYQQNQARWRALNREKLREYNRNRIRSRAGEYDPSQHKKRYQKLEHILAARLRAKEQRRRNPEQSKLAVAEWKLRNPARAQLIARTGWINRRSRMRQAGKISVRDIAVVRARERCEACGEIHKHMEVDHIIPLSRGGKNHLSNLQLLCRPCNRSKWAKDLIAWMQERNLR